MQKRIADLKTDRDIAWAAVARAKGASRPPIAMDPSKLAAFSRLMRDRLTSGSIPFRRAYLGAIIDHIEVDDHQIRNCGRKDVLEQAVMAKAGPLPGVRSSVRKWRAVHDKSANTYVIDIPF